MRSWMIGILVACSGLGCSEETIEIPRGTQVAVALESGAWSDQSRPGDEVVAVTTEPIQLRSKVLVPTGTRVLGVVTSATPASPGDPASLAIEFRQLEDRFGKPLSIDTHPIRLVSPDSEAGETAAPAAEVDVVGGAVEPQEAVLTSGQDIALQPGQRVLFRLDTPVRIYPPVGA
jgi:hypothetical protein